MQKTLLTKIPLRRETNGTTKRKVIQKINKKTRNFVFQMMQFRSHKQDHCTSVLNLGNLFGLRKVCPVIYEGSKE